MNKKFIVIIVILLLLAGVIFIAKSNSNQPITELTKTTAVVSPTSIEERPEATNFPTVTMNNLDKDLEKELNQLDQDISSGSKEVLKDSDFNF